MAKIKERFLQGWREVRGNIAVELIKWLGGTSVLGGLGKAISQYAHHASVDWILFACMVLLGFLLIGTALFIQGRERQDPIRAIKETASSPQKTPPGITEPRLRIVEEGIDRNACAHVVIENLGNAPAKEVTVRRWIESGNYIGFMDTRPEDRGWITRHSTKHKPPKNLSSRSLDPGDKVKFEWTVASQEDVDAIEEWKRLEPGRDDALVTRGEITYSDITGAMGFTVKFSYLAAIKPEKGWVLEHSLFIGANAPAKFRRLG